MTWPAGLRQNLRTISSQKCNATVTSSRAEAAVDVSAERDVALLCSVDNDLISVFECLGVTTCGGQGHHHGVASGHLDIADRHGLSDGSPQADRSERTKKLFDCGRQQLRLSNQSLSICGVASQMSERLAEDTTC